MENKKQYVYTDADVRLMKTGIWWNWMTGKTCTITMWIARN